MGFKFDVKATREKADGPKPEAPRPVDLGSATDEPSVLWNGHFYDYSGYAKANREVMLRVANTLRVSLEKTGLEHGLISVDPCTRRRIDAFRDVPISERAPLLRFFGPDYVGNPKRYRIVWTMMESLKIHHEMVRMVNSGFDELWVPTEWGRRVFVESGVKIPSHVYPLGVNSAIFRPIKDALRPKCRLLTTNQAGAVGVPSGFAFITVGLPSFRKGFDVMVGAFEQAFFGRKDVHLVLGVTHSLDEWKRDVSKQFANRKTCIWMLEGKYHEHEMARIYSSMNAYVTASRGEGFNLPAIEAASCGLPVIAPENTSHPEVLGEHAYYFPTEGFEIRPDGGNVSPWYVGVPFSVLGSASTGELSRRMMEVVEHRTATEERARKLSAFVRSRWPWESVAKRVGDRLLEVQP